MMKMMKRSIFTGFVLLLMAATAFSQQTEVLPDSVKFRLPDLPGSKSAPRSIDGFILPDITLPIPEMPKLMKDSMTMHITIPEYTATPWRTPRLGEGGNLWARDYNQYHTFRLNPSSSLSTYSTHNTYPTIGTQIDIGAAYIYQLNERWVVSGGIYTSKYTMPSMKPGFQLDAGVSGSLGYRINDHLLIRAYGQYSINGQNNATHGYLTPLSAPQSAYGTVMEIKVTDWLEIHGGVERSFDPIKRKWTTKPIFYPVIKLK